MAWISPCNLCGPVQSLRWAAVTLLCGAMVRRVLADQQHREWHGGAKLLLLPPWHLQSPSCWTCLPLTLCLMGLAMKGMKDKGNHLLLVFVHVSRPPLKTFVHWSTEILRTFLTHSSIYTFTVPWCEVGNGVGCLRYSVQCSEHSCEQGFSFKKTWRWLHCILAVKLFFLC